MVIGLSALAVAICFLAWGIVRGARAFGEPDQPVDGSQGIDVIWRERPQAEQRKP